MDRTWLDPDGARGAGADSVTVALTISVTISVAVALAIPVAITIPVALTITITVPVAFTFALSITREAMFARVLEEPPERIQPVLRRGGGAGPRRFVQLLR